MLLYQNIHFFQGIEGVVGISDDPVEPVEIEKLDASSPPPPPPVEEDAESPLPPAYEIIAADIIEEAEEEDVGKTKKICNY